jgi:hypothetical protein
LQKRKDVEKDLDALFEDQEEEGQIQQGFDSRELYEPDDYMDDFIIDDDEDEATRRERARKRRERLEFIGNKGADYGVSDE